MQYKTIVLELLATNGALFRRLNAARMVLAVADTWATELKRRHLDWMVRLMDSPVPPDSISVSSRALELAVEEVRPHLSPSEAADGGEAFDLDSAMAYLASRTPPA